MKKRLSFAIFILVLTAVPAYGQAQYCFGYPPFCQYLADTGFEQGDTYWEYSFRSGPTTVFDPCAWGGSSTTTVPDLKAGGGGVAQVFHTDDLPFISWAVRIDLYKTSTNVTAGDYFTVTVTNLTTGTQEPVYAEAMARPGLCAGVLELPLSYDYRNALVRVAIRKSASATTTMYVDNVAFFGRAY